MAASSSAAAAAEPRLPKYDVFISFNGNDSRKGIISHLFSAFSGKHIEAYIVEDSLEKGDTISRALPEAIKESEIYIIIFSEKYAESHWCLDELVDILKRKEEKKDQIVLVIFYNIDPSDIQNHKETYAAAFVKHEQRFEMEKVQKWREALSEAAKISGWDSREMPESNIVEQVVERVRTELDSINSKRSGDFMGLVGIPERLKKIKLFLDSPTVRTIGIWGMGGIGKTALAKAVFDQFCNDFEVSYYAPNVSLNAIKNKGLDKLENKVYSNLLGKEKINIFNLSGVIDKLSRKKILLVLDDVETPWQFNQLVRKPDQLCPGSKIIVTSRHKLKVDAEYKVEVLRFKDACELFYLNAFPDKSCRIEYEVISHKVVEYTKCHPLALEVLGANVFGLLKSIDDWEKELEKLKRIPNDQIQDVLKRSYIALDDEQKGLFLDIACFFKGQRSDFVEGILEDKPITGLVNRSLITIEDGEIHMHYLIQVMGRDIVLRSTKKLGERSRLWIAEDVSYVLKNNEETEAIEGIYFPWKKEDAEVHLTLDVFEVMRKLRLLKFYDASHYHPSSGKVTFYREDLHCLPNSLRYLHWEYYPGKSLPSNFEPQCLVELHMPRSKLEQLWDGVQELGSLKHINLFKSRLLTKIPDLSRARKLESINLSCCESLIQIPSLNLNLQATVDKSAYRHQWLSVEVDYFEFEAERTPGCIILNGCLGLTTLPKVGGNIRKLVLRRTPMEELPSSIESLENLLLLDLSYCYNLKSLPKLPRNIEVLVLNFSGIEQIPASSIEGLCSLRILSTGYCEHLEFIPETLGKLTRLQRLSLSGCSRLESLPMLSGLCCLTELDLSFCNIREIPASIGMLYMLKRLSIERCKNLQSLPELPLFIEYVCARDCSSLEMVSTLRSTLTLGRWLDKYDIDNDRREFLFEDCRNLCEDAINNIFREFLYKVFCTATTPPEVVHPVSEIVIGNLVVCYPTNEIPRWFNNQSEGSSITITLPPNWYNPKTFLGFVVSVIVVDEDAFLFPSSVECRLHLRTDRDRFRVDYDDYGYIFSSHLDHIAMWYNYFDHSKVNFEKEYIEALFEFESRNLKVKRCGVRMLYLRDAAEKSDDGTTANFESWIIDVNDSHSASDDDFQSCGSDDDDQSGLSMAASSSAVAGDPSLHKYDVFISFRGEDTRNSFTSHLYSALCQKRIKAYIGEVSAEKGDDIPRALPKAIQESGISIIIFSEGYASSRWCLDELVHILKCKEEKDQVVLPIFHGIDPSHVRKQKGAYAAAFEKHQERFKDKIGKVEEWRQALRRATDLSGWDSRVKYETVIVEEVVEDVIRKLKSNLKGFAGIRNITKVKPKFHVFISFTHKNTGKGFARHLYSALCQKQIKACLGEDSLERGDVISQALPEAIIESEISIIIFSKGYASSTFNLDELVLILKCRKERDQIVLPIFYGIDPSDIRKQKGAYAAAFVKHEQRFSNKIDIVQKWRQALTEAAGLSGWDSRGKSESVVVQRVVEDVMGKLQSISPISMADLKGNITSWQKGALLGKSFLA